jgi:hypothetical protein
MTLLPLCLLPPPSRTGKSGAKLLSITGMEEELDPKPPATAGARVWGGGARLSRRRHERARARLTPSAMGMHGRARTRPPWATQQLSAKDHRLRGVVPGCAPPIPEHFEPGLARPAPGPPTNLTGRTGVGRDLEARENYFWPEHDPKCCF